MPGWVTRRLPAVGPSPAITFTSPTGAPARSTTRASSSEVNGLSSEGLSTTPFPAASAGASCQPAVNTGAFHGVICAITPYGSRTV